MSYSKELSSLYDGLIGGYEFILHPTQKLVYEFTKDKKHVDLLELGCGTGTILTSFPTSFSLYGLDISSDMLAIAKKKVKRATLIQADMSTFHIAKKFDVIICVFDSINHLLQFQQWEDTFRLAALHLKKNGVFVFDMNTVKRFETLVKLPTYVKKEKDRIIAIKIHRGTRHTYINRLHLFNDVSTDTISLFEEDVHEAAFPTTKVMKTLRKYFTIEKLFDAHRDRVTKDSGRIFFACKSK